MKVTIEPYNPNWVARFEKEKAKIAEALAPLQPTIDHIGSTSIEDICAKPIIDILVGLQSENQLDATILPMMESGYVYLKKFEEGMEYRRFFVIAYPLTGKSVPRFVGKEDEILFGVDFLTSTHVHIMERGSYHWKRHIAFRDYLRAYPEVREEYDSLKKKLAEMDFRDRLEYNLYKEEFIAEHQAIAMMWFEHNKKTN